MTVEQKVGQVIQSEIRHTTPEDVKTYHLGSVLNGGGSHPGGDKHATPADWLALADAYWDAAADTANAETTARPPSRFSGASTRSTATTT